MILLAILTLILAHAGHWTAALTFALPLAFVVGRKSAIRSNGAQMIRTGAHRLGSGTW